jgi:hypothetical protein
MGCPKQHPLASTLEGSVPLAHTVSWCFFITSINLIALGLVFVELTTKPLSLTTCTLLKMVHDASASEYGNETPTSCSEPNYLPASEHDKEASSSSPIDNLPPDATLHNPPTDLRQNLFMIFITLTQLVQMIPLGAGINSGLAIGEALGASHIDSVWIVASYPLTQGAFVLIGKC